MTTTRQVALVTGASAGIGKSTAIALAAAGFQVIGTGRKTAGLNVPAGVSGGDDPAVVAKVIVAAATDRNPKMRRTAGSAAARISMLRRVLPARTFDRVVRRFYRLPG